MFLGLVSNQSPLVSQLTLLLLINNSLRVVTNQTRVVFSGLFLFKFAM